jgi:hypothetical protein
MHNDTPTPSQNRYGAVGDKFRQEFFQVGAQTSISHMCKPAITKDVSEILDNFSIGATPDFTPAETTAGAPYLVA